MPTYLVEVEETFRRTYAVHARDRHEAWHKATHPATWEENGDTAQRIDFEVVDVSSEDAGLDEMGEWKARQEA